MNLMRAIIVHVLAVSLLVVSVCPCSGLSLPSPSLLGRHMLACSQCGLGQSSKAPAHNSNCCCRMLDGKCSCGMACCCSQGKQQQVPPTTPSHQQNNQDHEQVVLVFVDVPAALTAYQSLARLQSASLAGSGCLPPVTLQSRDVRIQT